MMDTIKVLIADDIEPIRMRYAHYIQKDPLLEIVASVSTGRDAVEKALELTPDVVLMDVEMETRTAGLDATSSILEKLPNTKIIILTVYEDDETVFNAFQLGVIDYLIKNATGDEITACIKDAYAGHSPIRPVIAEKIRREFQRVKGSEKSFLYCLQMVTQLTQTEIDILDLLSQGYTRSQICEMRFVELSTVKTQIRSILKKFGKDSIAEVISMMKELHIFEYIRDISKNMPYSPQNK